MKRKPLSDLYVNGKFTDDREEWQKELQRHCEDVKTDQSHTCDNGARLQEDGHALCGCRKSQMGA